MSPRGQQGVVYVEFLLVFTPIFIFFLCILQYAFIYSTHIGVKHAAAVAARGAIVILDDDPARYNDQRRRDLNFSGDCGGNSPAAMLTKIGEALSVGNMRNVQESKCVGGPRGGAIRTAAVTAMLAHSPPLQNLLLDSTTNPFGSMGRVVGKIFYAMGATAVTFPTAPGVDRYRTTWAADDDVTVRVSFLHYCPIPIASLIMCDRIPSLYSGWDLETGKRDRFSEKLLAARRVYDASSQFGELYDNTSYQLPIWSLAFTGGRFKVMRAEATMPIHGAAYSYRSELR